MREYSSEADLSAHPNEAAIPRADTGAFGANARGAGAHEPRIVIGTREQIFHLLAEAAEVEHTLMCSYLYAAFSLKRSVADGLSQLEAEAVGRWRQAILSVATDEMVHLLLVANLSIAVGGRPHFARPNFPVPAGYFPSGVVVKLTPFSSETLDHLIFLERPRGVHEEDGDGFATDEKYRREEAYHGLMPSVQDYTTVGRLYEALRANLAASAKQLGEKALFIGPVAAQLGPDVAELEGVATIDSLASALRAIDCIVEQGEGSPGDREDSHYHRFLAIREEYEKLSKANPRFAPAWPVAESPVMRRPPEPEDKVFIDDLNAARVLDFGNAVYGALLRLLVQAFGRQGKNSGAIQRAYLSGAIDLMHLLERTSSALVKMPGTRTNRAIHAGMTFTMLRSVEPLMQGVAEQELISERLLELADGAHVVAQIAAPLATVEATVRATERKLRAALGAGT